MSVVWLEREEVIPTVIKKLKDADVVLDIGCGIMPQPYVTPKVHICCEPFKQYVGALQERFGGETDRTYVILNSTWAEAVRLFPAKSVDTVFLVDVVEHLEKQEGVLLLEATKKIARGQIAVFTPLGFMPQEHPDGKDAWNLEGGAWQEHKSGWLPEDFGGGWTFFACQAFHETDSMGRRLDTPFGAFWAVWEAPKEDGDKVKTAKNAPKSLWQNFTDLQQEHQALVQAHQALAQEHQALQNTRAVIFAKKLEGHPLLLKFAVMAYEFLVKIYRLFGG